MANIQIWRNTRIQNSTTIFTINHILADTIYSRELRTISTKNIRNFFIYKKTWFAYIFQKDVLYIFFQNSNKDCFVIFPLPIWIEEAFPRQSSCWQRNTVTHSFNTHSFTQTFLCFSICFQFLVLERRPLQIYEPALTCYFFSFFFFFFHLKTPWNGNQSSVHREQLWEKWK